MLISDVIEKTMGMHISLTANVLPKYSNIIRITTKGDENDGDYKKNSTDVIINTIEDFLITVNAIRTLKKLLGKYSHIRLEPHDIQAIIDFDKNYAINEFAGDDPDEILEIEKEFENVSVENYSLLECDRDYGFIDLFPRGNDWETEVFNSCTLINGCHSLISVEAIYFDETGYSSVLSV